MKLTEFYSMNEARSSFYTLEPESNGNGRLLAWESLSAWGPDAEEETSYEVAAHGGIEQLIAGLPPELQAHADEIRSIWPEAVQGNDAVYVDQRGVDITNKSGKGDVEKDDGSSDYESDNPNSYF